MAKRLEQLRQECQRLRLEERLSLNEIVTKTGAPKSTVHYWLRDYPLAASDRKAKEIKGREKAAKKKKRKTMKERGCKSKFYNTIEDRILTRTQKAGIAESAVLFRLFLHGFVPFAPIYNGGKIDWLVHDPESNRIHKIQVKWVEKQKSGLPVIPLRYTQGHAGHAAYQEGDFDFIMGYDLYSDTVYVFAWDEVKGHRSGITIKSANAERWDKLR